MRIFDYAANGYSRLIIRNFQLVFSAKIVFFFTKNQPEQYFNLFFSPSERGHNDGLNRGRAYRDGEINNRSVVHGNRSARIH
jgi:hypothetical protein